MQTRTHCRPLILVAIGAAVAALTGCGGSTARIAGQVTHNGEPVSGAEVVLESPTDAGEQYYGLTTEDGSLYVGYRDKPGVAPGPWKIRVTDHTQRDGRPLPGGEAGQALRASNQVVVRTYLFDQELTGGRNELELKLEAASSVADGSAAGP